MSPVIPVSDTERMTSSFSVHLKFLSLERVLKKCLSGKTHSPQRKIYLVRSLLCLCFYFSCPKTCCLQSDILGTIWNPNFTLKKRMLSVHSLSSLVMCAKHWIWRGKPQFSKRAKKKNSETKTKCKYGLFKLRQD